MEDSFRVRVDKAFGSLASTISPSSNLSSLWSLTDDEIERNEWNREKNSPETQPSSYLFNKGFLSNNRDHSGVDCRSETEKDLDDLDDDDFDDDQLRASSNKLANPKPNDYNDEEWEIRNSVGLDCTLDYEEEEDQYDKVAVGNVKGDDRLYLKDVIDDERSFDSSNEHTFSIKDVVKDPRANHIAARLRLKEDAEAAEKMDSLRVSELKSSDVVCDQVKEPENANVKSILKRRRDDSDSKSKDDLSDSKSQKRVRFDEDCKDPSDDKESDEVDVGQKTDSEDKSLGIPDYLRNPSKYTRYSFDSSSDLDEQSNRKAYMDFLKMMKSGTGTNSQADDTRELPKSLTFIPKRKTGDSEMVDDVVESKHCPDDSCKESLHRRSISIAAAGIEDSEPSAMDEDEPETATNTRNSSQKAGRKYRMKSRQEIEDPF